jgi:hypothetical protein
MCFRQVISSGNWMMASQPRRMRHDRIHCTGRAAGNSSPTSPPQALLPKLGTARWDRAGRLFPR